MSSDLDSPNPIPTSVSTIQNANWSGFVPVVLTLAPTSLSSPVMPLPLHKMVSRATYLHVGLHDEVLRLFEYAPAAGLSSNASGITVTSREEPPESLPDKAKIGREDDIDKISLPVNKSQFISDSDNAPREGRVEPPSVSSLSHGSRLHSKPCLTSTQFPECWFEDEESGLPLRWQLFVGVSYDLMKGKASLTKVNTEVNAETAMRHKTEGFADVLLPWRLRLHFTTYPTTKLLPLNDLHHPGNEDGRNDNRSSDNVKNSRIAAIIARMFRNSLKQALFLQFGSSKVAMSISKKSHEKMWDAVLRSDYESYREVNSGLQVGMAISSLGALATKVTSTTLKEGNLKSSTVIAIPKEVENALPQLIPVRVMLNGAPAVQKTCDVYVDMTLHCKNESKGNKETGLSEHTSLRSPITLGDILANWFPNIFFTDSSSGCTNILYPSMTYYSVQGIQPSLSCAMVDLWRFLCHPDQFLYVIIVTV